MGGRPPANAVVRGGALIAVTLLVGLALLAWGFGEEGGLVVTDGDTATTAPDDNGAPDGNGDDGEPTDPNGEGEPTDTTEAGPESRPAEETVIYVRNGSGVGGAAASVRDVLLARNYVMRSPDNYPDRAEQTVIYHVDGWRPEALDVARELDVDPEGIVQLMPEPAPGGTDLGQATILVVLGEDQVIPSAGGG